MLDLLYSYRKRQFKPKDVKDHILVYATAMKELTNFSLFDLILQNFDWNTKTMEDLVSLCVAEVKTQMYTCRLYRAGSLTATGKSVGEISKIVNNRHLSDVVNRGGVNGTYVFAYAKWIFTALDEIFSCICYNGGVSALEYVGLRTGQYLKAINLDKVPKRFGSPYNRDAQPLSFNNGAFSLSSPPMTTLVHKRSYIDDVYRLFGYNNHYEINIGKTLFARCTNFRDVSKSHIPIDLYKTKTDKIKDYNDVNASFVYDYFLCTYVQRLTGLEIDEDTVFSMFTSSFGGTISYDDKYLSKLKIVEGEVSLPEIITLVY